MIEFDEAYRDFLKAFGKGKTMVLSTAEENKVTSRMMSVVQLDGQFYFQTDRTFRKYRQLIHNPQAALCIDNIQIEGRCTELGHPLSNPVFCEAYHSCYEGSYNRYSALNNERLFVLEPSLIQRWRYIDGVPFVEQFDVENKAYKLEEYAGV